MISKEAICKIVISTFAQLDEEFGGFLINNDTELMGMKAVIDSLQLVALVVAVEEKIGEEFDVIITLADEKAMSQKSSPFRTVKSLTDYIFRLLEGNG